MQIVTKILVAIVAVVALLPCLLYIPAVQHAVKDFALRKVSGATGMEFQADKILISWPLEASVEGLKIIKPAENDTLFSAQTADADLQILPLLQGEIDVDRLALTDATLHVVNADSSLILGVRAKAVSLLPSSLRISSTGGNVNISDAAISDGHITLLYDKDKVQPDTLAQPQRWRVNAAAITLHNTSYSMHLPGMVHKVDALLSDATLRLLEVDTDAPTGGCDVNVSDVLISDSQVLYIKEDIPAEKGMDFNHLQFSRLATHIHSLYNNGPTVVLPIDSICGVERCGLEITSGKGTVMLDSVGITLKEMALSTVQSRINVDAHFDMNLFSDEPSGNFNAQGNALIAMPEVGLMMPALQKAYLNKIPHARPLELDINIEGSDELVLISTFKANLPHYATAQASGKIAHPFSDRSRGGDVTFNGRFNNVNFAKSLVLSPETQRMVNFPPVTFNGNLKFSPAQVAGKMKLLVEDGTAVGDGSLIYRGDQYQANITLEEFPMHAVLPLSEMGNVTATFSAQGSGFDLENPATILNAKIDVSHYTLGDEDYRNVAASINGGNGKFVAHLMSGNTNCDFDITASGTLDDTSIKSHITGKINDIDLHALELLETPSYGCGTFECDVISDWEFANFSTCARLSDFVWTHDEYDVNSPLITIDFKNDSTGMALALNEQDLKIDFSSVQCLDQFMASVDKSQKEIDRQLEKVSLNVDSLQPLLPKLNFNLSLGEKSMIKQALAKHSMDIERMKINARIDSAFNVNAHALEVTTGTFNLDTITFDISDKVRRQNHYLAYRLHAGNRPGNNDQYAQVTFRGGMNGQRINALLEQQNISGVTGTRLGFNAWLSDSITRLDFFPEKPIIGFHEWNINEGNFIEYDVALGRIKADLNLKGITSDAFLQLVTSNETYDAENISLKMKGFKVSEWTEILPFMPDFNATVGADLNVKFNGKHLWGAGSLTLDGLVYNRLKVGDVAMNTNIDLDPVRGGSVMLTSMMLNGVKVGHASGLLTDSLGLAPLNLSLDVDHLPLAPLSAFVPDKMATLDGSISGHCIVGGSISHPIINGNIATENLAVNMSKYSAKLKVEKAEIDIDSGLVVINRLPIAGANGKAVLLNGNINTRENFYNPYINLTLSGNDVQIIDGKESRRVTAFGRGFFDINGSAVGALSDLDVDARVTLKANSNITYVMENDVSTITQPTNTNMVHFTSLTDSIVFEADSLPEFEQPGAMKLTARITAENGSIVNAYLSTDGRNRVQVEPQGSLNFEMYAYGSPRINGRINLNNGTVRYTPPLISEQIFKISSGSNITFNGAIDNPSLDLKAVESLRCSVSRDKGNSYATYFDISVAVTNTLSNMAIAFDLACPNDATVQNELNTMGPALRSSQAMNMIISGTYTGLGGGDGSSFGNNISLYGFMESQINAWAAKAIKDVDLSFGINNNNAAFTDANSMNYSYKVSKSLLNDRLKISVGGQYGTQTERDQVASNLFNDVSVEYVLNESGNMYLRLFRKSNFESVLEGDIVSTGIGFVIKRKLRDLRNMFRFGKHRRPESQRDQIETTNQVETPTDEVKIANEITQ